MIINKHYFTLQYISIRKRMLITIINNDTDSINGIFNDFDNIMMQFDALLINIIDRNVSIYQ